uniref:Uncharacterized protein LOC111111958 n=1 Tax=Crassostrea virginica TaxID=6565 RepID=A0A8B8BPP9_CRAVI|nr:uncharacterized protein LOC111111958 [Crassostrea virginica]
MYAVVMLVCCSWVALLCPCVQANENFALHQLAWQSSTSVDIFTFTMPTAGLAVDGRTLTCAESLLGRTAEWWVDLGGVKNIHHVLIQHTTGNRERGKLYILPTSYLDKDKDNTKYILGFSVYISNTTNKEDGVLCFRDTNYTRATIPNPANISCPYHGRYVIYYNSRTDWWYPEGYSTLTYIFLCEVEVYGKKPDLS